ncbi:hypothetical protein FRUB_09839 [Fimbriiglobus ruber]|uniref:Carboxypeptidase regulatory-like domain-containing protein n=1 Tax=Fimbriiglobus ruber TaxID=1908690 RepID=A0A225DFY3_9BACT|nr:hypothetical protein FRUB_09839 [Fimbriiglobus ruber]
MIPLLGCFVLFASLSGGCERVNRLKVYPVRGEVTVDGKPAAGARIFFHPEANLADPRALRPIAIVEADGSFRLTTYLANDGAPAGEYVVTVTWPTKAGADEEISGDRLKYAYADAKKSKLRVTVKAGNNDLEPFRLK